MDTSPSANFGNLAIDAALDGRFEDAVKLNKRIIREEPQNVDALNRQARCYMDLGKFALAKKYYSKVLKFDPYNPIASKNLKIIKTFKSINNKYKPNGQLISVQDFLQEPGKTKVVTLLKVAEPKTLSKTFCGMQVDITLKNKKIIVVDPEDSYLGVLPDDISRSLSRLIKGGNKYSLIIKSIKVNGLSVLIRETFRSKRFKNQPSFLETNQSPITPILTSLNTQQELVEENEEEEA